MKNRVRSRKKWILTPLIVFSLLVAFTLNGALSQPPQPQTSLGPNWEQVCSNGVCTLTVYSYQKYYQEKGEWVFLNESFGTENCQKGYAFCVDRNEFQFHVKSTYDSPMIKRGSTNITFSLLSLGNSMISKKSPIITENVITYKDILPGIDLRYTYTWSKVKEEIILNSINTLPSLNKNLSLKFKLNLPANTHKTKNRVVLYNNPEEAFVIQNLIAKDSKGVVIPLDFTMDELGNLNITTPLSFLTHPNISYPVIIDPTISVTGINWNGYVENNLDYSTFTRYNNPDPIPIGFWIDPSYGELRINRADIDFDISSIPDNSTVTAVNLTVTWLDLGDQAGEASWRAMEQNSSDYPDDGGPGSEQFWNDMKNGTEYASGYGSVNISENYSLSQQAVDDLQGRLGENSFSIGVFDTEDESMSAGYTASFASKDNSNSTIRPYLTIIYEPWANESEGDQAIEEGIQNELGAPVIYNDQKIHILNKNDTQYLGYFDKVVKETNQSWIFNYVTPGEEFTLMPHLIPIIYVGEAENLAYFEIAEQVEALIESTKI